MSPLRDYMLEPPPEDVEFCPAHGSYGFEGDFEDDAEPECPGCARALDRAAKRLLATYNASDLAARDLAQDIALSVGLHHPNLLATRLAGVSVGKLVRAWDRLPADVRTDALTMLAPYIEAGHMVRQALLAAGLLVPPVVAEDFASSGRFAFAVYEPTDEELALAGGVRHATR